MSKKDDELDRTLDGFAKYDLTGKLGEDSRPAPRSLSFICPECGSREWGSRSCTSAFNTWRGQCHGFGCDFSWHRATEDHKYFKEVGQSAGTDASEEEDK